MSNSVYLLFPATLVRLCKNSLEKIYPVYKGLLRSVKTCKSLQCILTKSINIRFKDKVYFWLLRNMRFCIIHFFWIFRLAPIFGLGQI